MLYPYRCFTLWVLERLLARRGTSTCYEPVRGRVLYVASNVRPFHYNGYSARTHEILRALQQCGADVRVMTRPGYPWDMLEAALPPGTKASRVETVEYAHSAGTSLFRPFLLYVCQAAEAIAEHAKVERVAVIHAATNFQNALPALVAARRLGVPFQYEMRGLWELTRASR